MEDHDHRNNNPSSGAEEHSQMHHCGKCGWPFPNPHPSAKHRRAHRKICGTIEGYKREEESPHLNVFDVEHSDDDNNTPSVKTLERGENERGSGGIRRRSNLSEDEVFSDAVSNFADINSSTVTEVASENVLESECVADKVKEDVPADSATPEVMQADDSADGADKQDPLNPDTTADLLGSKLDALNPIPSSNYFAEKSTITTINDNLIENSVLIKPDPPILEAKRPGEEIAAAESLLESNALILDDNNVISSLEAVPEFEETFEMSVPKPPERVKLAGETDPSSLDNNSANNTLEATPKLEGAFETSIPLAPEDVKLSEETNALSLDDNMSNDKAKGNLVLWSEHSPEEKASSQVSLSADSPQVDLDKDQNIEFSTSANDVHENDGREGDEKFQVFSMPHDVPKVENPETIVEGFKDHKRMGWFQADNSATSEGILEKDQSIITSSKSQPEALKECPEVSPDLQNPEGLSKLDVLNTEPVDEEILIEGQFLTHHENKGLAHLGISRDSLAADGEEVRSVTDASSEREFSGSPTELLSGQTSIAASLNIDNQSLDDKLKVEIAPQIDQTDKLMRTEEKLEKGVPESASRMETGYEAEEDDKGKRGTEENPIENLKVSESTKNLHDKLVEGPVVDDRTSSHEKHEMEKLDVAAEKAINSVGTIQESSELENKPDCSKESVMVSKETILVAHENQKEGEMNGKDESMQISSEDRGVEVVLVTSDTASLPRASAAIGVGRDNDLGGPNSSHLQREGVDNHVAQPIAGSMLDASVDTISTDSLDANWGSVSVLSTQSDNPAAVEDSKAICSTSNLLKLDSQVSKVSDKSEVFEPPSFMTLVEPGRKDEKTTTSSKQEQPMWFPSLTNVSNDSPGRKKNEEIIAKVTNWSSKQQQHSPLKSLLMEANRDAKPKSSTAREDGLVESQEEKGVTVDSILHQKIDEEKKQATAQDWNSPARYPAEIKRENRKVKGRPYWAQFVCCSSVN